MDSWPKIPKEAGPAPQSGPRFETERIPNPVHEPASRFRPALRLLRRSCAESTVFDASRLNPSSTPVHLGLVRQPTKHRFYRAWVTVKPVGSAKSGRPKVNFGYKDATPANGSEERTGEMLRVMRRCDGYVSKLRKG
ncbi:hypothetical protein PIB30_081182 [Stylosanthes scabra]|uniref:Uncharacterized protein n=1 Tax=Stylosanthes scabra TaxID=79078 RepID=A0ABU6TR62_9FABA|nr:hypothetical protein [Stylosanthes scabra]